MINAFYSNSNILNIPRELYKKEGSNNIFKASSLLLGSNYQNSFKNSINNYESNRVAGFVSFFNKSLKSINAFTNDLTKKQNENLYNDFADDISSSYDDNNDYFKPSNNAYNIVSSFNNFVDDINFFLDTSKTYKTKENDNLSILNTQIENDLESNKEELYYFGISLDDENRLEFDEDKLLNNLDDSDRLSNIASKDDSIFNKILDRTEKALNDPIAKYIPEDKTLDKKSDPTLFNYKKTSEKLPLNSFITTGNIIDYRF